MLTPNCGTQQCPGAAEFYSGTLYYIGNGHDATIWVLSRKCAAGSLNPAEDPDNEQNYSTQTQLQNEPNFQNCSGGGGTAVPPACAVAGDYLDFVWIQWGTSIHDLSWRLYLLQASTRWTKELPANGDPTFKDPIDPNSAPWRIVLGGDPGSIVYPRDPATSSAVMAPRA